MNNNEPKVAEILLHNRTCWCSGIFSLCIKRRGFQSDTIRVAAVGLGGRGTGAIGQILDAKDLEKEKEYGNTKLVAVADAFSEKVP